MAVMDLRQRRGLIGSKEDKSPVFEISGYSLRDNPTLDTGVLLLNNGEDGYTFIMELNGTYFTSGYDVCSFFQMLARTTSAPYWSWLRLYPNITGYSKISADYYMTNDPLFIKDFLIVVNTKDATVRTIINKTAFDRKVEGKNFVLPTSTVKIHSLPNSDFVISAKIYDYPFTDAKIQQYKAS